MQSTVKAPKSTWSTVNQVNGSDTLIHDVCCDEPQGVVTPIHAILISATRVTNCDGLNSAVTSWLDLKNHWWPHDRFIANWLVSNITTPPEDHVQGECRQPITYIDIYSYHQVPSAKYTIDMSTQLEVLDIYLLPSLLHNTLWLVNWHNMVYVL